MVQIETLRLFILGVNDKRVHGNFGLAGALYSVPQQAPPKFSAVIGESDGKAPQACDRYCGITWQAFGEPNWHLSKEHPACCQRIEAGNPI